MRLARFGGRHVAIAFALGLAGAIAACGGDDSVTPGDTGGSGGTMSDGGKGGGGTGGDASPDRGDARTDATGSGGLDASGDRGGGGGTGGADVGTDARGGGGVDASPDVVAEAQPDVAREVSVDTSVADQLVEARADVGPDGAVTPDAGPDVVADVTPDRGPDVGPDVTVDVVSDARDGGAPDVAAEADAGDQTLAASTYPWDPGTGTPLTPSDAGHLTWVATYGAAGAVATLTATVDPAVNWSAYPTLQIHINATGGVASVATIQIAVQGSGDAEALNITSDEATLQGGEQDLFLNLTEEPSVQRGVGNIVIILNSVGDAGVPPPTTIEVDSITLQAPGRRAVAR